jgi:hypothetical protein
MKKFSDKVVKQIKVHFTFNHFFRKIYEIMKKIHDIDTGARDDNMAHAHCMRHIVTIACCTPKL